MIAVPYVLFALSAICFGMGINSFTHWLRSRKAKLPAPTELDALVRQERVNPAEPLVTMCALNLPIDVKSITLTLHYEDGCHMALDCGKPEPMKVEP